MDPILDAIAAIEAREPGESFSYREVAKRFGVDRTTLSRRHQGNSQPHIEAMQEHHIVDPHHEKELVQYIESLTARGLPPSKSMIKNFASTVSKWEVLDRWVDRFLDRNNPNLTIRYTVGIDRDRQQADTEEAYRLYFDILNSKIKLYEIEARHSYNMDEKGFFVGKTTKRKRVFSRQMYEAKLVKEALQDGDRSWVTLLAAICADGTSIDPAIIFAAKGDLRENWVTDLDPEQHQIFCATSPSGWSNNDLGLAWLEQVFDRCTKEKARSSWRLLVVDGHASHLSMDFIDYCDRNKILLAILPPHTTHVLQPLDVGMFKPLSTAYTTELEKYLHRSQGLIPIQKGDFLPLFWAAWSSSFTSKNILSSFRATGISPPDPDVILQRFKKRPRRGDNDLKIGDVGDGSTWKQLQKLCDTAVKDTDGVEAEQLRASLHSIQVQNELLHHENEGLRSAITTKKKRPTQSKPLELHQREEYRSGAVFWSPRKVREVRARERVKEREKEAEELQKKEMKELKEANSLYKKKIAEEAKVERAKKKEEREREKKAKAEELAAARAKKKQEKEAATTQKLQDRQNTAKRKASRPAAPKK